MTTIYLLEQNQDLATLFSTIVDKDKNSYEFKSFNNIRLLVDGLKDHLPDLLLVDEQIAYEGELSVYTDIISKLQESFISRIVVTTPDKEIPLENKIPLFTQCDDNLSCEDNGETIIRKIESHIQRKKRTDEVRNSLHETGSMAENVMQLAGDMGEIFHFSQEYSEPKQIQDIAEGILALLAGYKAKAVIMIKGNNEKFFFANNGRISELDKQIMIDKNNDSRFVDFGLRTQVNFPLVSVLIKNMPKKDNYQFMRIKDNLIYLLHTSNNIISKFFIQKKNEQLLDKTNQNIELMETMFAQLHTSQQDALSALRYRFEDLILSLGLTEEQEEVLSNIIQDTENKTDDLYNFIQVFDKMVKELRDDMQEI